VLTVDGSKGEGGGQVLRTALALSAVTGTPFRLERIRARRKKPGLMRQHLTCVQAAAAVCGAGVTGADLGSQAVSFHPGRVRAGEYFFSVGTAGSALLVLQTVLPPLLLADAASRLRLEGGTHNPLAPPFEFLARAFLPLVRRAGASVDARLERYGFFPAGGGAVSVEVTPGAALEGFDLVERGEVRARRAVALVANLPASIGERELRVVRERLGLKRDETELREVRSAGPGNALLLEFALDGWSEVFTAFGERGLRAEDVARRALAEAEAWLAAGVPVGAHLADQWLLILALAGRGRFRTLAPTNHTLTNAAVIRRFLPVPIRVEPVAGAVWEVRVG
jgi:RNA 3'-terminal phosphate cyclase (ATP)